jgi:hypothetical protein
VSGENGNVISGRERFLDCEVRFMDADNASSKEPNHLGVAKSQSVCREANEQIAEEARTSSEHDAEFVCECADLGCRRPLSLPIEEYEMVRHVPTHFIVAIEHVDHLVERVVDERAGYAVVELSGQGGVAAVKLDRRIRQRLH